MKLSLRITQLELDTAIPMNPETAAATLPRGLSLNPIFSLQICLDILAAPLWQRNHVVIPFVHAYHFIQTEYMHCFIVPSATASFISSLQTLCAE